MDDRAVARTGQSTASPTEPSLIEIPPGQLADVRHKRPALKALTSIRFFAAMYVVLFHLHVGFNVTRVPRVAAFMASGYTGVTLFFVLSGFILAYNYPHVTHAKDFWIARFARIYPVYFLSLSLSLLRPAIWHGPHLLAGSLLDFSLLQAWWIPLFSSINSAAWTLSVEAFFYAMFPLLLPLLRTMRTRTFLGMQAAYVAFVCLPIALSFSRHAHAGIQLASLIEGPFRLFRLNTFAVGVFVGLRYLAHHREPAVHPRTSRTSILRLAAAVASAVGLLCLSPSPSFLPLRTLLLTYTFLWVIVELAAVSWPVLTNHWMQVAGEISYGIYILQFPIGMIADGLWRRTFSSNPLLPHILAVLVAAYVSFKWFELPARLTIRRVLTGHPVPLRPV